MSSFDLLDIPVVVQGDLSQPWDFYPEIDGVPVDMTGRTAKLKIKFPDKTTALRDLVVVSANPAHLRYSPVAADATQTGIHSARVKIYEYDLKPLTYPNRDPFQYQVIAD